MTLNVIALVYALVASGIGWAVLLTVGRGVLPAEDRTRYLASWILVTVTLFLVPNGTIFLAAAVGFLLMLRATKADPVASAMFLIATVPPAGVAVYNLPGGINYLLDFTFALILSAILLTPVALRTVGRHPGAVRSADLFFYGFVALVVLLDFRDTTFTSGLRAMTQTFFVTFVPYLAISRGIRDTKQLKRVVGSLLACLIIIAIIGFVGSIVRWQIYDVPVRNVFGAGSTMYLVRAGMLRTGGTLGGSPISFGMMMMVGAALCAAFGPDLRKKSYLYALMGVCLLGLLASVSRGPMIGAAAAMFAYQLCRPNAVASSMKAAFVAIVAFIPLYILGPGQRLIAGLPFIGTEDTGSVDYRQELFTSGMKVIARKPLFGSPNFRQEPEMQALVQGQGIIDLVNTYIAVGLEYGLIALFCYMAAIASALVATFRLTRRIDPARDPQLHALGAGLFAAQFGYALTIATTSLTGLLPYLGWMLLGLSVAYVRTTKAHLAERASGAVVAAIETEPAPAPGAAPDPAPMPEAAPQPAPTPARARSSVGLQAWPDDIPPLTPAPGFSGHKSSG